MSSLYKLSNDFRAAMDNMKAMLENEDIDQAAYQDTMDGLTGELTDKCVNVGLHIKNLRSDVSELEQASKEFQARLKKAKSNLEFYENYLERHMIEHDIDKLETAMIELSFKKLPDLVEVDGDVPVEYSRVIPESHAPDKKAIADALKSGEELDFAHFVTGRKKLNIK